MTFYLGYVDLFKYVSTGQLGLTKGQVIPLPNNMIFKCKNLKTWYRYTHSSTYSYSDFWILTEFYWCQHILADLFQNRYFYDIINGSYEVMHILLKRLGHFPDRTVPQQKVPLNSTLKERRIRVWGTVQRGIVQTWKCPVWEMYGYRFVPRSW